MLTPALFVAKALGDKVTKAVLAAFLQTCLSHPRPLASNSWSMLEDHCTHQNLILKTYNKVGGPKKKPESMCVLHSALLSGEHPRSLLLHSTQHTLSGALSDSIVTSVAFVRLCADCSVFSASMGIFAGAST